MSEDVGRVAAPPGSREPSQQVVSAASGFDPSRFEWRQQTTQFARGKNLLINGLTVGSAYYDGVSSKAVADRYRVETKLPGLRPTRDRFATEAEAMAALERFTLAWLSRVLARDRDRSGEAGETPKSGSTAGQSPGRASGIAQ